MTRCAGLSLGIPSSNPIHLLETYRFLLDLGERGFGCRFGIGMLTFLCPVRSPQNILSQYHSATAWPL